MAETSVHAPASAHRAARLGPLVLLATMVLLAHVALPQFAPAAAEVRSLPSGHDGPPAAIVQSSGNPQNIRKNTAEALMDSGSVARYSIAHFDSAALAPSANAPLQVTFGAPAPIKLASALGGAALKVPPSVRLQYDVRAEVRGLSADALADLIWRHDDHAYSARLDLTLPLVGTRTQTSVGRITPEGLAPTRFSDKARRESTADFERTPDGAGGKIVFSAHTPDAPLLAGAQDRLSAFVQLGALLAGAPGRYPAGSTIRLQIVGPRDAEIWLFRVEGMQQLRLPYGTLETVKLTRNPPSPSDSKLEMWLAPSMDYLPVRIRLTQANGERFDQRLRAREGF